MVDRLKKFAVDALGDVPSRSTIDSAEDGRRYLRPYLFKNGHSNDAGTVDAIVVAVIYV